MKILGVIGLLLSIVSAQACDICGCVNGNASIGTLASNRFSWWGVQSAFRKYETYSSGIRHSQELYWRSDLLLRWNFHPRIQLFAWLPHQTSWQIRDLGSEKVNGWGDAQLMLNVVLLDKRNDDQESIHFLAVGAMLKMPTGKRVSYLDSYRNLYPGTGSWDHTYIAQYSWRFNHQNFFQSEGSYSIKGKDQDGFRNGNAMQISGWWTHKTSFRKGNVLSSVGWMSENYDSAGIIGDASLDVPGVTGYVHSVRGGIYWLGKSGMLACQLQMPVFQNLNQKQIQQRCGVSVGYQFLIKQKNRKDEK